MIRNSLNKPGIVIILTGKNDVIQVGWMTISYGMLIRVPPPVAKIKAPHESKPTIDEAQLLMMRPIQNNIVVHSVDSLQGILGKI